MNKSKNSVLKNPTEQTLDESTMISFDHVIINANIATFSAQYGFGMYTDEYTNSIPYGQLNNAAIGIKNGSIAWIGEHNQITAHLTHYQDHQITDVDSKWDKYKI